jgi:hypothetical protein
LEQTLICGGQKKKISTRQRLELGYFDDDDDDVDNNLKRKG